MSENTPSTTNNDLEDVSHMQILEVAFQKAFDNGWRIPMYGEQKPAVIEGADVSSVIFSHDFAKALWGEEPCEVNGDDRLFGQPLWKYHLQEMVIAPNPIAYLGHNI